MRKTRPPKREGFFHAVAAFGFFLLSDHYRKKAQLDDARLKAEQAIDRLHLAEARKKQIEAQTELARLRALQIPEQTEGTVRRYLMTTENTENAILRQTKQGKEIELLKLKIRLLEQELGVSRDPFTPENYPG